MLQSYKTIKRAALSEGIACMLFLLCFLAGSSVAARPLQTIGGKRGPQFFAHYAYRFQVPASQVEAIRKFLEKKYSSGAQPEVPVEKEVLTEFYFDDEKRSLRKQNVVLRHRVNLSATGRKERVQLLLPPEKNADTGQEILFRSNRKPDKGTGFTVHPLQKLLRTKDRPVLDSLLKPLQLQTSELKLVLEITQHREQFHLQKQNNGWLVLSLTKMQTPGAENEYWEIQITPERKLLTHAAPDVKKQLLKEVSQLAQTLKDQFPALKPQTNNEYAVLLNLTSETLPDQEKPNYLPWIGILVVLILIFVLYKIRKKHLTAGNN